MSMLLAIVETCSGGQPAARVDAVGQHDDGTALRNRPLPGPSAATARAVSAMAS